MHFKKFFSLVFIFYVLIISSHCSLVDARNKNFAKQVLSTSNGRINEVFFVPGDNVKKLLLSLIDNEKNSILLAQFRITDKDIAQALCDAHKRGVRLKCITDYSCCVDKYQKLTMLQERKIPIAAYKKSFSIMHHKFFIFGRNIGNKPLLWTGSANGSRAGTTRNQENVIITNNKRLIDKFRERFGILWQEIKEKSKKELLAIQKQKRTLVLFLLRGVKK